MTPPAPLLIVEDDEDAVLLIQRLIRRADIQAPIDVVSDGEQAIAYFQQRLDDPVQPLPELVLLDLKLPRTDGFEVLDWIHLRPVLRDVKILVMSSSNRPQDMQRAHDLGATDYLEKYPSEAEFMARVRSANYLSIAKEIKTFCAPSS